MIVVLSSAAPDSYVSSRFSEDVSRRSWDISFGVLQLMVNKASSRIRLSVYKISLRCRPWATFTRRILSVEVFTKYQVIRVDLTCLELILVDPGPNPDWL